MKENSPLYLTIYFSITSLAVLSPIPRTFDRRCCRDVNSTSRLYISPRMHPRSGQDADAIPIGRPATTRVTLDVNAAARLARSKSILSLVKRQKEREKEGGRWREEAAIEISAGFITQPGGNEPRNPGRGASYRAKSLRWFRQVPARVYGVSCRGGHFRGYITS